MKHFFLKKDCSIESDKLKKNRHRKTSLEAISVILARDDGGLDYSNLESKRELNQ